MARLLLLRKDTEERYTPKGRHVARDPTVFACLAYKEASLFGDDSCSCPSASPFSIRREIEQLCVMISNGKDTVRSGESLGADTATAML